MISVKASYVVAVTGNRWSKVGVDDRSFLSVRPATVAQVGSQDARGDDVPGLRSGKICIRAHWRLVCFPHAGVPQRLCESI
jgi:hypothetical protein